MDLTAILSIATTALTVAQAAFKIGEDALPLIRKVGKVLSSDTVTPEELADIETDTATLSARLQQPLPPAQPGDPDYQG